MPHPAAGPAQESPTGYIQALLVAVLLGLGLRLRILHHYLHHTYPANLVLDGLRNTLMTLFAVVFVWFLVVYLVRTLPRQWRRKTISCGQIQPLLKLATALTLLNLVSENLAIYRLNLESYSLLLESLSLYSSVTLVFLVWYWTIDHPPRSQAIWLNPSLASADAVAETDLAEPYGIVFPEEALALQSSSRLRWRPSFIDYFYFTVLCSNCFGPPEGHALVGRPIKTLHIVHSMAMISVFIVILARAINTLS